MTKLATALSLGLALTAGAAGVEELVADANIAYRNGRLERAEELYNQALAAEPQNVAAINGLGLVAMARGDYETALDRLLPLVGEFQNDANFLYSLGSIYKALGDYPNAIDVFSRALELTPDDPPLLSGMVESLLQEGRIDEALPLSADLVELDQRNADYLYLHGMANRLSDNHVNARRYLESVLQYEPGYELAFDPLFETYLVLEDYAAALEHAQHWVEVVPGDGWAWRALGMAHYKNADFAGAFEAAQLMLELGRVDNQLLKVVSHWLRATDRGGEARRLWERAVELQPYNMVAQGELGGD